jgi:exosortase A-associated hydrolase 2
MRSSPAVELPGFEAGFRDGARGPYFYVLHTPARAPVRGAVLYFHPFAEELNKSRRMAALQARRFAAAGYAVLLPDHYGCGDSGGDFGDARWEDWLDDLGRCGVWLRERYPGRLILWGLRTGCLLLSDLVSSRDLDPAAVVLWQPVTNGDLYLNQFLRLRVAATMLGGSRETTADLRRALTDGESLEVAGYRLDPRLARALASARLQAPPRGAIHWLEVSPGEEGGAISPAGHRMLAVWADAGSTVNSAVVNGEAFWATQEICEAPALIEATMRCCPDGTGPETAVTPVSNGIDIGDNTGSPGCCCACSGRAAVAAPIEERETIADIMESTPGNADNS